MADAGRPSLRRLWDRRVAAEVVLYRAVTVVVDGVLIGGLVLLLGPWWFPGYGLLISALLVLPKLLWSYLWRWTWERANHPI